MSVQVSGSELNSFEAKPEGVYNLRILTPPKLKEKGEAKLPTLNIRCNIQDGELQGEDIYGTLWLTEKSLWIAVDFCDRMGIQYDRTDPENPKSDVIFHEENFVNAQFRAPVGVGEYGNDVDWREAEAL